MSATRSRTLVYLIGSTDSVINGNKLPSNGQMLKVFFYNHTELKKTVHDAAVTTIDMAIPFWDRARIPLRARQHLITKLENLFGKWKTLKKTKNHNTDKQKKDEAVFCESLDDLFVMAHQDALTMIKIEDDRQFLLAQREKGRRGCMTGIDKIQTAKEQRAEKRKATEAKYK
jgi:hypothetical protein